MYVCYTICQHFFSAENFTLAKNRSDFNGLYILIMSTRNSKVAFEDLPEEEDEFDLNPDGDEEEEEDEDEDEEEEEEDGDFNLEMEAMDETLAAYLTTEDGDNVATALMSISDNIEKLNATMDVQNKILIKIASQLVGKKN